MVIILLKKYGLITPQIHFSLFLSSKSNRNGMKKQYRKRIFVILVLVVLTTNRNRQIFCVFINEILAKQKEKVFLSRRDELFD